MTRTRPLRTLYTIDLFAGAGGLALGFQSEGFHPLVANDFDVAAGLTFAQNFKDTKFIPGPIEVLSGSELMRYAGVRRGELDVLLGGPPCQAFSVYNHQRGFHDERSGLFREYLRIVEEVNPKMVVMENVVGMTSLDGGRAVDEMYKSLGGMGYSVEHRILRAEEFGVPQERRRLFFIASRIGPVSWPEATHGASEDLLAAHLPGFVTVRDAIGDLPRLEMGDGTDDAQRYTRVPRSEYQIRMRNGGSEVFNHLAPQLTKVNAERMKHIPQGGSWRDLPRNLLPAGMKLARRSDHTKRYGRLDPNGLFSTILTKADIHWGAYIHPDQDRSLTVRECARAQGFPDTFRFFGPRGEQFRQVGNAVPPVLAEAVARSVRAVLAARAKGTQSRRIAVGARPA